LEFHRVFFLPVVASLQMYILKYFHLLVQYKYRTPKVWYSYCIHEALDNNTPRLSQYIRWGSGRVIQPAPSEETLIKIGGGGGKEPV
jgi:hypothetical protein